MIFNLNTINQMISKIGLLFQDSVYICIQIDIKLLMNYLLKKLITFIIINIIIQK